MTERTVQQLKDQFQGTDPQDQMDDLTDSFAAKASGVGDQTFNNTVITYADNATSFRLKGPQHSSEGGADVQSYAGMFYDDGWDTVGSLKTRATFSGNADMDLSFQTPERLLLLAEGSGDSSADIALLSEANIVFHTRADSEAVAPNRFIIDRVDTGDTGGTNTSDVNLTVNTGNLRLMSGRTDGAVIFPSLTTTERDALTAVNGMVIYNETTGQLEGYDGAWQALHA